MKKIFAIMLIAAMALCLTGCNGSLVSTITEKVIAGAIRGLTNASVQIDTESEVATESVAAETIPGEDVVAMILEAVGEDTIARAKDAGITLSVDITGYSNGDILYSIEIRSAISSTWPDNTVDWEVMRDIQTAVLDLNLFNMSADDISLFKDSYYTPSSHYYDIDISGGINLHVNETPSYEAIVYIRHSRNGYSSSDRTWTSSWKWDECTYSREVQ